MRLFITEGACPNWIFWPTKFGTSFMGWDAWLRTGWEGVFPGEGMWSLKDKLAPRVVLIGSVINNRV